MRDSCLPLISVCWAVLIVLVLLPAGPAYADTYWQGAPNTQDNWFQPSNWVPNIPGPNEWAIIDNRGTAVIAAGHARASGLSVGAAFAGAVAQTAGITSVESYLYLALAPTSTGSYSLANGSLAVAFEETVGQEGTGTFTQSGGTNASGWGVSVGMGADAVGTYTLNGGSLGCQELYVAGAGSGTFTQSGGISTVGYFLRMASGPGGTGTYNLTAGSLAALNQTVGMSGAATFNQSGGTNTGDGLCLGLEPGSMGTYLLSGGSVGTDRQYLGWQGTGWCTQSGGVNVVAHEIDLAGGTMSMGVYELSGGSLQAWRAYVGDAGIGSLTQTGGTAVVTDSLELGFLPGSIGIYNLGAGSLRCDGDVHVGHSGTGIFYQYGGTHTVAGHLYIAENASATGQYLHEGGLLNVGDSTAYVGGVGYGTLDIQGGSFAGRIHVTYGLLHVGSNATVTAVGLSFADEAFLTTVTQFDIADTGASSISGAGSPTSAVSIGGQGNHTLDLYTAGYRPHEGDAFYVLTGFHSIAGAFDHVTTDVTGGQQTDPVTGLIPFFAAAAVADPNAPGKVALCVTFQGLTAGDANGDHKVDGGDLALMGGNWMLTGIGWGGCNFNGDPNGLVDGGDLALMGGNWMWSLSAPPAPEALPEPATLALLALGAATLTHRRRRCRSGGPVATPHEVC